MGTLWELMLVSSIIGAGIGLAYGAMPALVMSAVPVSETAAANSLNTLMRSIGTSISSAVAGVVLAQLTITFGPAVLPSRDGFRVVMVVGAAAALIALLVAAFLPRMRRAPEEPPRSLQGVVSGAGGPGPARVTVTAHRADGSIAGTTGTDERGHYRLDGLPAEPLTLVAVEHPVVHETVTIAVGRTRRHDITMP
jgi:MFS family permease